MPRFVRVNDKSHIGGMDTVLESRADTFGNDRCLVLKNAFPGDPPIPRNSCRDMLVDNTAIGGAAGSSDTLFQYPGLIVRNPDGELFFFVFNAASDSSYYYHQLEVWDLESVLRYYTMWARWTIPSGGNRTYFGILALYGAVYAFTNRQIYSNIESTTQGLSHKAIEWNSSTSRWEIRDMFMNVYAVFGGTHTVVGAASGLTSGLWVSYHGTFVRRTDDAAFSGGEAIEINTFDPAVSESYARVDDRQTVFLDNATEVSFGDSTTQLTIEEEED